MPMKPATATVAIIAPRHLARDVRVANKEGRSLVEAGFAVMLVVRAAKPGSYLGMTVVPVNSPYKGLWRFILNLRPVLRQALRLRADIYVLQNPDTLPLALLLRALGKTILYDTHEDFSRRVFIHPAIPALLKPVFAMAITCLEWLVGRLGQGILVTQPGQVKRFGRKALLLDNAPLTRGPVVMRALAEGRQRPATGGFNLIYAGSLNEGRCTDLMLRIVCELNKNQPTTLNLVGWFYDAAQLARARAHPGWRFVHYTGHVDHATALAHIMKADIGLALLKPDADVPDASITKIFEYMLFEVPFIASDFPRWRELAGSREAGLFTKPEGAARIATQIQALHDDPQRRRRMGAAGRAHILTSYNWESRSRPFVALVNRLAERRARASMKATASPTSRSAGCVTARRLRKKSPARPPQSVAPASPNRSGISSELP